MTDFQRALLERADAKAEEVYRLLRTSGLIAHAAHVKELRNLLKKVQEDQPNPTIIPYEDARKRKGPDQ